LSAAPVLAGVDGCKAGWVVALRMPDGSMAVEVVARFEAIVERLADDAVIAVDMPIGLPDRVCQGGRGPEALVRRHLGPRQSSVFSIPSRAAVYAQPGPFASVAAFRDAHASASAVARATSDPPRAISIQAFGIFPKIREIDMLLAERPELRGRIVESHPELAFWRLNGERAMHLPKRVRSDASAPGIAERSALLASVGFDSALLDMRLPRGVGHDDLLDACAMLAIAERRAKGLARPFPDPPGEDAHGNPIAIWA
jgi:predicted RNase H-like nuclease